MDIVQALEKYDADIHPSGETLPEAARVYRVKVLRTFLKAGVAIKKIDDFRDLGRKCSSPCWKKADV